LLNYIDTLSPAERDVFRQHSNPLQEYDENEVSPPLLVAAIMTDE